MVERAEMLSMRNRGSVNVSMEELHLQMVPVNVKKAYTGLVVKIIRSRVSELEYQY